MTTFPDKPTPATSGLGKWTVRTWLGIVLIILLAATMLALLGGAIAIHCAAGALLLTSCSLHLTLHGRWLKAVILNAPKTVTPILGRQRRMFWGLLISGLFCGVSGATNLLSFVIPHHVFCCGHVIHILAGLTFLGLSIYHLVLHKSWFKIK